MNSEDLKRKATEAAESVKRFNAKPPMWFYWVAGVVVIIGAQILRQAIN